MRKRTNIGNLVLSATAGLAALALSPAVAEELGSRQTRDFIQAAAQSDTFEILEAQTVLAQSADLQVRAFAQQMIEAHTATSESLKTAASHAGLKPPTQALSSDQALLLSALQGVRGAEFDKMYLRHQALAHLSAMTTEQQYASNGDQPAVRAAAASATPLIASHLEMAEQMQAKSGQ
jgi:putative membrane protein